MDDFLKRKLHTDVEGTCTGRFGYIINVLTVKEISKGKVLPSIGLAEFTVKYQAIVFKPFKGEVVDGTVTSVNKMGFFAEVGPLQVFVSSHLIPSDMKFNPYVNPPAFSDENNTIEKGSNCRIKIVGTRFDATDIFAIGTIKEDFCGIL
ncbi:4784_t:CDS:2 [Ambispora leptoticha]|uniref:4784_t:CDS:1 n=1 Tax=Ambispora leptoticha TaxID=144679 RepID=A0A9N9BKE6_9GLOM|nr:4784_t:CDS:2 [Ambispora leptoticha]